MNRIEKTAAQLADSRKKALVPYITAGYPSLAATEKIVAAFEKNGADMIEIGMPFSDPIADGPVIQQASNAALKAGMSLRRYLRFIAGLRTSTDIPLIIMSYYNPIYRMGLPRFARAASRCGLDGVIVPDLPPEESGELERHLQKENIALIFLVSPLTGTGRAAKIAARAGGFIYYVSLTGVTGARSALPRTLFKNLYRLKEITSKPVFVGFGVSTPQQARSISRAADGVIVGSAIIKMIIDSGQKERHYLPEIARFMRGLRAGTRL